jgi:hypothetical protein
MGEFKTQSLHNTSDQKLCRILELKSGGRKRQPIFPIHSGVKSPVGQGTLPVYPSVEMESIPFSPLM